MLRVASLIALLLMVGCASHSTLAKNSPQIRPGMTADELRLLLGEPVGRLSEGDIEAWQYCVTDRSGFEANLHVLVWLRSGVVTGKIVQKRSKIGTCLTNLIHVRWEDAPKSP